LIGNFLGDDKILVCYKNGDYELTSFELTNRYESNDLRLIQKFDPQKVLSAIYFDGATKTYFVKRFLIETTTVNKRFNFISDHKQSYLKLATTDGQAQVVVTVTKGKEEEQVEYDLEMLIDVKGWKAIGNKVSAYPVKEIQLIESEPAKSDLSDESEEEEAEIVSSDEQLEIGSTIDLTPKKDDEEQLGLF
jgi:topoisomerase-4 subunit A